MAVPANIAQTSNLLPHSNMEEGSVVDVKLKRKLTYKGYYEYQFVEYACKRGIAKYPMCIIQMLSLMKPG